MLSICDRNTFSLRLYRHILLRFYYVRIAAVQTSNVLENNIAPTPNPTLNLPNSVNKSDIKMHLLMQLCYFNFIIHGFELFNQTVVPLLENSHRIL